MLLIIRKREKKKKKGVSAKRVMKKSKWGRDGRRKIINLVDKGRYNAFYFSPQNQPNLLYHFIFTTLLLTIQKVKMLSISNILSYKKQMIYHIFMQIYFIRVQLWYDILRISLNNLKSIRITNTYSSMQHKTGYHEVQ